MLENISCPERKKMAPHVELLNEETQKWEEVPETRHETGNVQSEGARRANKLLFESAGGGIPAREVADELGPTCR